MWLVCAVIELSSFLPLLFGLRAQSDIYILENFHIMDFRSPMLEYVLYKIYNYVILKRVGRR